MLSTLSLSISQRLSALTTEQGRQRMVSAALDLTHDTPLAAKQHERLLLQQFVRGELTIDQVLVRLGA